MDINSDLVRDIACWHAATFRNATDAGQLRKFFEEEGELDSSVGRTDGALELADMYIVACYFASCPTMFSCLSKIITAHKIELGFSDDELDIAVKFKMIINKKRIWEPISSGEYQHVNG